MIRTKIAEAYQEILLGHPEVLPYLEPENPLKLIDCIPSQWKAIGDGFEDLQSKIELLSETDKRLVYFDINRIRYGFDSKRVSSEKITKKVIPILERKMDLKSEKDAQRIFLNVDYNKIKDILKKYIDEKSRYEFINPPKSGKVHYITEDLLGELKEKSIIDFLEINEEKILRDLSIDSLPFTDRGLVKNEELDALLKAIKREGKKIEKIKQVDFATQPSISPNWNKMIRGGIFTCANVFYGGVALSSAFIPGNQNNSNGDALSAMNSIYTGISDIFSGWKGGN